MVKKDPNKPKGRMSSYAFFVQVCREEHKKLHPTESVVFTDFSRKCADRWKYMSAKEKARFEEMAAGDKRRYEREMATYTPVGGAKGVKRKRTKDPDAPKRSLSAFFFFCKHERASVKIVMPDVNVAEVAKELGKRWEKCTDRKSYEVEAAEDKRRYEKEMIVYKGGEKRPAAAAAAAAAAATAAAAAAAATAAAASPAKKAKNESEEEEDEEDDDDDDDEDDEDDDE